MDDTKHPGGRPSKFTPERCASIIKDISDCIPYELAAEANGIGEETLYGWLRQGRKDEQAGIDSEFAKFSESIKKVERERMRAGLAEIQEKPERWQAQAWILERRWWKHFSPNAAVIEFNKRLDAMEKVNGKVDDSEEKQNSEK